ncbi:zinc finger BED domain-containing protein 4-like, partial [Aphis craccivora]
EDIPTFSMVNPLIYTIETKLNNFIVKNSNTAAGLGFARNLKKSISNRFQACKNDPAYLLATAIDPRFKTILMESYKVENVKRLLTTEVEKVESLKLTSYTELKTTEQNIQPITVPVPTNTLWDILQERSISITGNEGLTSCVKNEIQEYLQQPLLPPTSNPLCLSIPGTSVCSERMFCKAGQVVTARRQRLSPRSVEKLVFLHDNI